MAKKRKSDNNVLSGKRQRTIYSDLKKIVDPSKPQGKYHQDLDQPSDTQKIIGSLADKISYSFYNQHLDNPQDRKARYIDFEGMEFEPILSSALDIYADECTLFSEEGKILEVYSQDRKIKKLLEDLFSNVIDIENNAWAWIRNMAKYGDLFVFTETEEGNGIVRTLPLPAIEIEKEIGYDEDSPEAIRYKWAQMMGYKGTRAAFTNQLTKEAYIDDINMTHFGLGADDKYLPYSRSILDPARRIWKQLTMLEDAMMVYRITRSPERRVFNIEVGNMNPKDIPDYIEQVKRKLKKAPSVTAESGLTNLRYNPLAVDEDYFIPSRGGVKSEIDTLPGAQNLGDIDDVRYIQQKLFSVLKIPKAYLSYEEDISAKALLSQEDVRFARTIERVQRSFLAGLSRMAIIHLYLNGIPESDILNFKISMTNPSHQAELMQIELWNQRIQLYKEATGAEKAVSVEYGLDKFMKLSKEEIKKELESVKKDPHEEMGTNMEDGGETWEDEDTKPRAGYDKAQYGVAQPTEKPMAFESVKKIDSGGLVENVFEDIKNLLVTSDLDGEN
tara:strand:- start:3463 stop:5136 length:1674 start_codon:yes stop_codon:yes gene_type:complete